MTTGDEPLANGEVETWTFDVGQADARLMSTEQGENVFFDADRNAVEEEFKTALEGRTDERTDDDTIIIDYTVFTHIDQDHVDGLSSLSNCGCDIQQVVHPDDSRIEVTNPETGEPKEGISEDVLRDHKKALSQIDADVTQVSTGDSLPLDSETEVKILGPPTDDEAITFPHPETGEEITYEPGGTNANGIVSKIESPEQSALLMGDVDDKDNAESWYVHQHHNPDSEIDLAADELYIPHHGSSCGTTRALLNAVEPNRANISSALDQHGHPGYETFDNLHEYDADMPVDWTSAHGRIHNTFDASSRISHTKHGVPTTPATLAQWKYEELKPDVVAKAESNIDNTQESVDATLEEETADDLGKILLNKYGTDSEGKHDSEGTTL